MEISEIRAFANQALTDNGEGDIIGSDVRTAILELCDQVESLPMWKPVFGLAAGPTGTVVMKVVTWLDGPNNMPPVNLYLGTAGLTADIAQAINIRGLQGVKPGHGWNGTRLTFENPDGTPGVETDLKGATGDKWIVWRGGWMAATFYSAGDGVSNGGNSYRRKADGTSGVSFDPANWDIVALGGQPVDGSVSRTKLDAGLQAVQMQLTAQDGQYVYAITDANDKAALAILPSGEVLIPKFILPLAAIGFTHLKNELLTKLPGDVSNLSGYVWSISDANDKVAIGIDGAGNFLIRGVNVFNYLNSSLQDQINTITPWIRPAPALLCAGDSLTAGTGGTPYPTQLATLLNDGRAITNLGRGGDTSTQIAFRQGAGTVLLQVSGNQIPASGAVVVMPADTGIIQPVTGQIAFTMTGVLFGIAGTLSRLPDASYTFTRTTAGAVTIADKNVVFVPGTNGHDFSTQIIWAGRNNYTSQATVLSDIASMVALLKPRDKRFLVLSVLNSANGPVGSTEYNQISSLNQALRTAYPRNYVDVREALIRAYNPANPQDVTDFSNDVPPGSLRSDLIHPNTAGYAVIAQTVKYFLNAKNW